MADDVIERAEVVADISDVEMTNFDVLECERLDDLPRRGDLAARQIDAQEGAMGQGGRHRDEVPPIGAPDSRTRQLSAGAAPTPSSLATVAKRSGCV